MEITLYVSLIEGTTLSMYSSNGELWTQRRQTDWLPTPGMDSVVLWPTDEEGAMGGPMWDVKRRYMDAGGGWHVELSHVVMDPVDELRHSLMQDLGRGSLRHRIWWTESDGDPVPHLEAAGWRRL